MKAKFLAVALLSSALVPAAFANSNAGSILFFCTTPQNNDLAQADYEALTWIQVKSLGNMGETGSKTNVLNYDTWDTTVIQKAKGLTDAGSPTIEVARIFNDPGQLALRAAALTNLNYAFKMVRNDAVTVGGTGTVLYNRGLVMGPTRPGGKNEDFDLEVFTLGLNQKEVVVQPGAGGVAPAFTAEPTITGTATHGVALTASTGTATGDVIITYAYQWYAGGVAIAGANAASYTPVTADIGKILQVRVIASNASGSATGFSAPTAAVA